MDKPRLEFFSDGVFAIILTILVIELEAPSRGGLEGLHEIAFQLFVHAIAFLTVGTAWIFHHRIFLVLNRISTKSLAINLVALFWITLLPFGAKIATNNPTDPLGVAMMCVASSVFVITLLLLRPYRLPIDANSQMVSFAQKRNINMIIFGLSGLISAALCWVSTFFGFLFMISTIFIHMIKPAKVMLDQLSAESGATNIDAAANGISH